MMLFAGAACTAPADETLPAAAQYAAQRVVKIYGAGIGLAKDYAVGVVVSPDGQIVTVDAALLEGDSLRVVLPDGRRLEAELTARDELRQLALLKVEASDLPCFELGSSESLSPGDWVLAAANPFKVAAGPEPVSVAAGVFAGRAPLAARRRAQDFGYDGPVLLTDIVVATPGSAGGALVDANGKLVGVIGKAVISMRTNTWVNYALPVEVVADFVRNPAAASAAAAGAESGTRLDVGFRLFDVGGRWRPAYVERVRRDSPAAAAGLRSGDLILAVNDAPVQSCEEFDVLRTRFVGGARLNLLVKRGAQVESVEFVLEARDE